MASNIERTAELSDFGAIIYRDPDDSDLSRLDIDAEQRIIAEDLATIGQPTLTTLLAQGMYIAKNTGQYTWIETGPNRYAQVISTGCSPETMEKVALQTTREVMARSSLYNRRVYLSSRQVFAGYTRGYDSTLPGRHMRKLRNGISAEEGLALLAVTMSGQLPHRDSPEWPEFDTITDLMQAAGLMDTGLRDSLEKARKDALLPPNEMLDYITGIAYHVAAITDEKRELSKRMQGPKHKTVRWLRAKVG